LDRQLRLEREALMNWRVRLLLSLTMASAMAAPAQVLHVTEMNTEEIRALDRGRTVVLLPGGILEEHGPYLPSFTDGYQNERLARDLAEAIASRPGWKALVFPIIPLGAGGANQLGGKYSFPGTFAVRASTLRDVFMDLGDELAAQGFRRVFIVHLHGAPNHHIALDEAGDYFHDLYGGDMVNLFGRVGSRQLREQTEKLMTEEERRDEGWSVHADMNETSRLLFLRPDLVRPAHKDAINQTARDRSHLIEIARAEGWAGYFGSPRRATASFGAASWRQFSAHVVEMALRILDGADPASFPRASEPLRNEAVVTAAFQHEEEMRRRHDEWLRRRR